jgi:sec-independent protein translocase protein TatB
MPQIGPLEILVVGAIALVVFGPDRLPQIARQVGRAMQQLRRMASDVQEEFRSGFDLDDDDDDENEGRLDDSDVAKLTDDDAENRDGSARPEGEADATPAQDPGDRQQRPAPIDHPVAKSIEDSRNRRDRTPTPDDDEADPPGAEREPKRGQDETPPADEVSPAYETDPLEVPQPASQGEARGRSSREGAEAERPPVRPHIAGPPSPSAPRSSSQPDPESAPSDNGSPRSRSDRTQ